MMNPSHILRLSALMLALLLVGFLPVTLPSSTAQGLKDRVAQFAGLSLRTPARVKFYLLPIPSLRLEGIILNDHHGKPLLTAKALRMGLKLGALLLQKFEPDSLVLEEATLTLANNEPRVDKTIRHNNSATLQDQSGSMFGGILGAFLSDMQAKTKVQEKALPTSKDTAPLLLHPGFASLALENSKIVTAARTLDAVNAKLIWQHPTAPLTLDAAFSLRNSAMRQTRISFEQRLVNPAAMLTNGLSSGHTIMRADSFSFSFAGNYALKPDWRLVGDSQLVIAELDDFLKLIEPVAAPASASFDTSAMPTDAVKNDKQSLNINAHISAKRNSLSLANIILRSGYALITGSMALYAPNNNQDSKQSGDDKNNSATLSATLAMDTLNCDPLLASLSTHLWGTRSLAQTPYLNNTFLSRLKASLEQLTLDVRLSVTNFTLAKLPGHDLVASFLVNRNSANLKILEAHYANGTMKAQIDLSQPDSVHNANYGLNASLTAKDIDVGDIVEAVSGFSQLDATATTIALSVSGQSPSLSALPQSLTGTLSADFSDGQIQGFQAETLLRDKDHYRGATTTKAFEKTMTDLRNGRTVFSSAHLQANISEARLEPLDLILQSPSLSVMFNGQADLISQQLDMMGSVKNKALDTNQTGSISVSPTAPTSLQSPNLIHKFHMTGSIKAPQTEILDR